MSEALPAAQSSIPPETPGAPGIAAAQGEQYLTVQALRFIAAFAVVVLHSSAYAAERLSDALGVYSQGAAGVRLFFVISGFVMMVSSLRLAGTPLGWRVFAAKRVIRIAPMYWLVTSFKLATMLAVPAVVIHASLDWSVVAKSYAFWPAGNAAGPVAPLLGVGWTLNFEMAFYVLFAVALVLRMRPTTFIAPILLTLSIASQFKTADWPIPLRFWADPIVLDFLAGMLLAQVTIAGWKLPTAAGSIAAIVGLAYLFLPLPRPDAYGTMTYSLSMTLAALFAVAGAISLEGKIGHRVPAPILFMGAASYALYLVHPIVAPASPVILGKLGIGSPVLSILISLVLAVIAGALAYRYLEQPMTRWLNAAARDRGLFAAGLGKARGAIERADGNRSPHEAG